MADLKTYYNDGQVSIHAALRAATSIDSPSVSRYYVSIHAALRGMSVLLLKLMVISEYCIG